MAVKECEEERRINIREGNRSTEDILQNLERFLMILQSVASKAVFDGRLVFTSGSDFDENFQRNEARKI